MRRASAARGVLAATLVVTLLLPSNYTLGGVGAVGLPCVLLGLTTLWLWALGRLHPTPGTSRTTSPLHVALAVFAAACLITTATGLARDLNSIESAAMGRELLNTASYLGLALLAMDSLRDRVQLDRLLSLLVGLTAVVAVIGIVEFFSRTHPFLDRQLPLLQLSDAGVIVRERLNLFRAYSTTQHPIEFGVLLSTVLPVALHRALRGRRSALDVVSAGVIALALPLAVSRSAVLGLLVGLLVVGAGWSWPRRLNAVVAVVVLIAALRGLVPGLIGALAGLFSNAGEDPSVTGRTDDYTVVGQLFREHPFTGRGFGTYSPEVYRVLDNQYLLSLVNGGLVLLAGLVLVLVAGASTARGISRRTADAETAALARALLASVLVAAISFATFDGLTFRTASAVLFLLIGAIGALRLQERAPSAATHGARGLTTGAPA